MIFLQHIRQMDQRYDTANCRMENLKRENQVSVNHLLNKQFILFTRQALICSQNKNLN